MALETVPVSYQEVLDHLSKVASENGDTFKVKVVRRPNAATALTQHVATFADCTWAMIANAESWLAAFCGGGLYVLQVYDGRDARKLHGTVTPSEVPGAPRQPDARVTKQPGWIGPSLIEATPAVAPGVGAVAYGLQIPDLAPESQTNGSAPRMPSGAAGLGGLFEPYNRANEDLRRREAEIETKARAAEIESIRREAREREQRLEAQIADMKTLLSQPKPTLDVASLLTTLFSAAAPIVGAIMQGQGETRKLQAEIERTRVEREAKEREALAARPLVDPQILQMIEAQTKRSEEQITQFSALLRAQAESSKASMESQAIAQRSMLQTIADVAQLQLRTQPAAESEGPDWGKIVAGALSGLAAMQQAKAGGPPQVAALPPGVTPPPAAASGAPAPSTNGVKIPESDVLNAVEDRVRAKDPVDQVVADLKKALATPEAQAEVQACGGLLGMFEERIGDFASEAANEAYMAALVQALQAAGIIGGADA